MYKVREKFLFSFCQQNNEQGKKQFETKIKISSKVLKLDTFW